MLKLFHNPDSRSSRFLWLLQELGVDYELIYVEIPRGGKGSPDPSNPHPDKRVPAVVHDGQLITESSAIALYLTDAFPQTGLGPPVGDPRRADYLTWLAFYAGEMEPAFGVYRRGWIDKDPQQALATNHERVQKRVLTALSKGEYLLGDRFTAADVLVSSPYQWVRDFGPPSSQIDHWLARLAARPAAIRAAQRDQKPV